MRKLLAGAIIYMTVVTFSVAQTTDSIEMGPGYANDVFYSLATGEVKTEPNNNWHLGLATGVMGSSIIINDGTGMVLYTYPYGDLGAWDTISVDSIALWKPQYNSPDTMMLGAFDRFYVPETPDLGWGIYNMITHDVEGDSVYVIQLPDQSLKKIYIQTKSYSDQDYIIRYANLDGSSDTTVTIDVDPYFTKNFVYFDLETNDVIDREPADSWDILFTRYFDERIPYFVTGVVSNLDIKVARITGADTASTCYESPEYSERRTEIGSDWKSFNQGTFQYELSDSLVFVVKDTSGMEYILYFTGFEGSSNGKTVFTKKLMDCSSTGISTALNSHSLQAFPNPASDILFVRHGFQDAGTVHIALYYMTGKRVLERSIETEGNPQFHMDVSGLKKGLYILQLRNQDTHAVTRISVR